MIMKAGYYTGFCKNCKNPIGTVHILHDTENFDLHCICGKETILLYTSEDEYNEIEEVDCSTEAEQ